MGSMNILIKSDSRKYRIELKEGGRTAYLWMEDYSPDSPDETIVAAWSSWSGDNRWLPLYLPRVL